MAHTNEKLCFTVEVFIVFGSKVLLRMHDKYKFWLSVGGHIEPGEDPTEAAIREVKEEVGLDVELWDGAQLFHYERTDPPYRELVTPISVNRHPVSNDHEHVTFVYIAKAESDKVSATHDGDRSDEWGWFGEKDLGRMELRDDVRYFSKFALEKLGS